MTFPLYSYITLLFVKSLDYFFFVWTEAAIGGAIPASND